MHVSGGVHMTGDSQVTKGGYQDNQIMGGLLFVDMFLHNKSGIAYRDRNRRSETVVKHKREPTSSRGCYQVLTISNPGDSCGCSAACSPLIGTSEEAYAVLSWLAGVAYALSLHACS
jgi:hypothetical protein